MKTFKIFGVLVALTGAFCAAFLAEPSGVLAAIAGMFPLLLVQG